MRNYVQHFQHPRESVGTVAEFFETLGAHPPGPPPPPQPAAPAADGGGFSAEMRLLQGAEAAAAAATKTTTTKAEAEAEAEAAAMDLPTAME